MFFQTLMLAYVLFASQVSIIASPDHLYVGFFFFLSLYHFGTKKKNSSWQEFGLSNMLSWVNVLGSSSIKVKDEKSGTVYSVGAHDIGSASNLTIGGILTLLSVLVALLHSSIA